MLAKVSEKMIGYPSTFSNWGILLLRQIYPFYSVVIYGQKAFSLSDEFRYHYLPNSVLLSSKIKSELPLFRERYVENKTLIYVCTDKGCKLPVDSVEDALKQMEGE